MDQHVQDYYDYLDALYEGQVSDAMTEAEVRWEDNGCQWISCE